MADYFLCAAGKTLFEQVNAEFPNRDKASDGWIGDPSHAAAISDHNPCWSCSGPRRGVVRAIDIDASFGSKPGYNTSEQAWRLANQLRAAMRDGDGRISYIIAWDPSRKQDYICSMNPAYQPIGTWRVYTGDSHVNHIHVSFTSEGDFQGRKFDLPLLNQEEDEMTKEDWARMARMLDNRIAAAVPVIVNQTKKAILNADLTPNNDEIDQTVREALRVAGKKDEATA